MMENVLNNVTEKTLQRVAKKTLNKMTEKTLNKVAEKTLNKINELMDIMPMLLKFHKIWKLVKKLMA